MYWLIGTLIIVAMIGVLTVAADSELSALESLPLIVTSNGWFLPLLLFAMAFILILFKLRTALVFSPPIALVTEQPAIEELALTANSNSAKTTLPVTASITRLYNRALLIKAIRYLIVALLALALLTGSILQALTQHQQLQLTKVSTAMRVQAWVTIEGIRDSVYDASTNSGYRQVATLSHIAPLTAELSSNDLTAQSIENANNPLPKSNQLNERRVLLSLYPKKANDDPSIVTLNNLKPGSRILMSLSLAPLASSEQTLNNPTGFDSYRWLRARHIDGVATIIAVSSVTEHSSSLALANDDATLFWQRARNTIDNWRLQLRQHFYQDWSAKTASEQQAQAVTLSLLTGDRSLINRETKDLYQLAGISHLLAISGTHVLFMAIMLAAMAVLLVQRFYPALYRTAARWQVRWWVIIASAFIYALFTGFDVPAARTAWMLLALGLVRLTLVPISTMRVLLALAIIMAWMDPYVLWQAGYWLSFIAVALLLKYEDVLQSQTLNSNSSLSLSYSTSSSIISENRQSFIKLKLLNSKGWLLFKRIFRLQLWLFIALLPITLLLFGKVSLWGLVINLFAIGLFGWLIVPLNLLAGLCYLLSPAIADSIWALVSSIVSYLHQLIEWLTTLPILSSAWLYTPINFAMVLMAVLVILPWLLPRGLLSRLLSLPPLTLLLMTIYANQHSFSQTPTLYILPTGDRYITSAVLIYPIDKNNANQSKEGEKSLRQDKISWLFLADHRVQGEDSKPSSLIADKLTKILEQQLRTLAIKNLQGIIVQSSDSALTATLSDTTKSDKRKASSKNTKGLQDLQNLSGAQPLLALTVARLSQVLPTAQYWQAGRHELWPALLPQTQKSQSSLTNTPYISAQDCQTGKRWQDLSGQLKLQVLTGWREIDDASVWDCSVAIDSSLPITVVHYKASNPQQPTKATVQMLVDDKGLAILDKAKTDSTVETITEPTASSRLILDSATHKRSWQLWSLMCRAEPFALDISQAATTSSAWLSHSSSRVSTQVLEMQQAKQIITYDEQPLEAALMLEDNY
ncbi:ComEC/Rec2 family competence protein [Psychrobacter sp. AH5]|uniref:ComEC/Rec2 family competence protein n=1 Tax=Psychrobacter sp. AH5 TaxID=2937433 RepID=UPI00334252A4